MYKSYAFIKFENVSPLAIGSGSADETDKDIIRDSKENPYIPATALAGVYSNLFSENEKKEYFGFVDKADESNSNSRAQSSAIIVYDGVIYDGSSKKSGIRHGVGLDQFRTSIDGEKYDFEILEPGNVFWTAIEYTADTDETDAVNRILSAWKDKRIIVGGKSTRGLGQLQFLEIKFKTFKLPEETKAWLSFDIYDMKSISLMQNWKDPGYAFTEKDSINISLCLDQDSPVTVRVYTTLVPEDASAAPDYKHLTYQKQKNEKGDMVDVAVIPGTSWAGVFRHNMIRYYDGDWKSSSRKIERLFGRIGKGKADSGAFKSKIVFSETYFENGRFKTATRNAIDRFSGGASDKALFTEAMYWDGKGGYLNIRIPADILEEDLKNLAASIADLHEGFLTLGGESSIGHGLFKIRKVSVNNAEYSEEKEALTGEGIYGFILRQVGESKKEGEK